MDYYKSITIPLNKRQLELDDVVLRLTGSSIRQFKSPSFSLSTITFVEAETILANMINQNYYISDLFNSSGVIGKMIYFEDSLTYTEFMLYC